MSKTGRNRPRNAFNLRQRLQLFHRFSGFFGQLFFITMTPALEAFN